MGSGDDGWCSGLKGVVGFAVVGEVAHAVHGVFQEGRDGEDREANGRAGEGAGDGEDKTGGLTEEAKDADGFGVHTQRRRSQPVRCRAELRGYCAGDQKVVRPRCKERFVSASRYRWSRDHQISQMPTRENPINRFSVLVRSGK